MLAETLWKAKRFILKGIELIKNDKEYKKENCTALDNESTIRNNLKVQEIFIDK